MISLHGVRSKKVVKTSTIEQMMAREQIMSETIHQSSN